MMPPGLRNLEWLGSLSNGDEARREERQWGTTTSHGEPIIPLRALYELTPAGELLRRPAALTWGTDA